MKTECVCLPKSLKQKLDDAISIMEEKEAGGRSKEYERSLHELNEKIDKVRELMEQVGTPSSVIESSVDQMRKSHPKDPILKQFDDLRKWSEECLCDDDKEFDWTSFPYHEIGYRAPRTGTTGEDCTIDFDEKNKLDMRAQELANKYVFSLRDPVFLVFMKDKYGEQQITGGNVRKEITKYGKMTHEEMNEFNEIVHTLDKSCGRKGGDSVRKYDTQFLRERKFAGLLTTPREEFFGKKK